MSHDYAQDRDALGALLRSRASYIGVLGPRSRTDALLRDVGVADDPRVCAPVGLPIGAETPEEIALAILAEARARLSRPA
jgi:xanthine/CO dehydrogenase XdhC/CoxF family maturation factor